MLPIGQHVGRSLSRRAPLPRFYSSSPSSLRPRQEVSRSRSSFLRPTSSHPHSSPRSPFSSSLSHSSQYSPRTASSTNLQQRSLSLWPFGSSSKAPENPTPSTAESSTAAAPSTQPTSSATPLTSTPEAVSDPVAVVHPDGNISEELANAAELTVKTLKDYGLGEGAIVGKVELLLEYIHVTTGLSWALTIVATTLIVRSFIFPLAGYCLANNARLARINPRMVENMQLAKDARAAGDTTTSTKLTMETQQLMSENRANPFKGLVLPLFQAPMFITFFFALREMANAKFPGFQTGGMAWFTDLASSDPYFVLPVLSSAATLAVVELGAESGQAASQQSAKIRNVLRFACVAVIPFVAYFPAAVLVYWVTNNSFSLLQTGILKIPFLKRFFGYPDSNLPPIPTRYKQPKVETGFWEGVKLGMADAVDKKKQQTASGGITKATAGPSPNDLRERLKFASTQISQPPSTSTSTPQPTPSPATAQSPPKSLYETRSNLFEAESVSERSTPQLTRISREVVPPAPAPVSAPAFNEAQKRRIQAAKDSARKALLKRGRA